jgi:hypothetical protein
MAILAIYLNFDSGEGDHSIIESNLTGERMTVPA